jgi:hypothetical protein
MARAMTWLPVVLVALQIGGGVGGRTPSSRAIDSIVRSVTRPPSTPAPPDVVRPDMVYVPNRYVDVPGEPGPLLVPGHWERRISEREYYAPPLPACSGATGGCLNIPAGVRLPPDSRLGP